MNNEPGYHIAAGYMTIEQMIDEIERLQRENNRLLENMQSLSEECMKREGQEQREFRRLLKAIENFLKHYDDGQFETWENEHGTDVSKHYWRLLKAMKRANKLLESENENDQ